MARTPSSSPTAAPSRRMKGFEPAARLLADRIRTAGESRGFAMARLLTHWAEVVGEETAQICRPVKISYARGADRAGKGGFGAALTLLTSAAHAPVLQMQIPRICERVNACYGYSAVSRVVLTQTFATGFAEGRAVFTAAPPANPTPPDPATCRRAAESSQDVRDGDLRAALEALALNVLRRASHPA